MCHLPSAERLRAQLGGDGWRRYIGDRPVQHRHGEGDLDHNIARGRCPGVHAEDAILEPKPVQKPRPPVMIAGGGEQLTLRAVARLGYACNVGGDPEIVRRKLGILRGHCDTAQRDYDAIEKTHNNSWLLSRDAAGVAAKRERLSGRGPL
jgi:alkanesulfonate monooxygenase SsuD/methylene tetrahydromethanopterin reductase-like flavin-dependent oxidoreductase (luciferase family)